MSKRVYFAFHYQDVIHFRANVVRNSWVTKEREAAGFFDASIWESAKKTGAVALKRLINNALNNTSTTVVLIGSQTYARRWVRYEIMRSMFKGNNFFGVHINSIPDKFKKTKSSGPNPFDFLGYKYSDDGKYLYLHEGKNGKWIKYGDMDTYSLKNQAPPAKHGKFYRMSSEYKTYDWVANKGYNNFAAWIG